MFPGTAEEERAPVAGPPSAASVAPAGTDQLDLEAAEQLIQLSGGDDAGSEGEARSADSVRCCGKDKERETAVESRRMTSAGARPVAAPGAQKDGGEPGSKGGAAVTEEEDKGAVAVRSAQRSPAEEPRGAVAGDVDDDEEPRKRPRFRSLADIYRETDRKMKRAAAGERNSPAAKKKRAGAEAVIVAASPWMGARKKVTGDPVARVADRTRV